jgi:tRNA threonylcarbamoyladenosine biosynthesis protein TsaE
VEILSHSEDETKDLGRRTAQKLRGGEVLALYGDLGSGKTTFVQGLAEGLGIKGPILSPTFVIRRSYRGRLHLHHFDFYRLSSRKDLENLDLEETVAKDSVVVIEWPDKVAFDRPKMQKFYFTFVDEHSRRVAAETLS